jgi:predicted DNA-binding ribbon-helix-helix protein
MIKRSVKIMGHATSISLEEEFWSELKEIAEIKAISPGKLIADIDALREPGQNLSSAIRVYILNFVKDKP